jgi:hypothetical protein
MSISEPFRYRNDIFQFDIFSSDIGITDVDVGCRISPIMRSMSMPTYDEEVAAGMGDNTHGERIWISLGRQKVKLGLLVIILIL